MDRRCKCCGPSAGAAYLGAALSDFIAPGTIASNTWTPIAWNGVEYDTGGFWSGGDPITFVAPSTGKYVVLGSLVNTPPLAVFGTGVRINFNNGVKILGYGYQKGLNPEDWGATCGGELIMAANDFVRLETVHFRGTPSIPGTTFARFSIHKEG